MSLAGFGGLRAAQALNWRLIDDALQNRTTNQTNGHSAHPERQHKPSVSKTTRNLCKRGSGRCFEQMLPANFRHAPQGARKEGTSRWRRSGAPDAYYRRDPRRTLSFVMDRLLSKRRHLSAGNAGARFDFFSVNVRLSRTFRVREEFRIEAIARRL
jgi:hypothetical protein